MAYEHLPTDELRRLSWEAMERVDQLNAEITAERARLGAVPGAMVVVQPDSVLFALSERLNQAWEEFRPLHDAYYERVIAEDDARP